MPYFRSYTQFDVTEANLYWYNLYAEESELLNNSYQVVNGQTYEDLFYVDAFDGYDWLELAVLGTGIVADGSGNIVGGTANFIAEFDLYTDEALWYAEGISLSAASIYNAALTETDEDDFNLFWTAFAGDDTIVLSPYEDVMSGFEGDDIISGGGSADVLAGGGGNDTFIDTAADMNGDSIVDFGVGDSIIITDATPGAFTYSLSGGVLTYTGGSLTLGTSIGGTLVASAAAGGGVQLTIANDVRNDFDGDGISDVLFRHEFSGELVQWLGQANGTFVGNQAAYNFVHPSWQIAGTGDFNGDGRYDILWHNANSGGIAEWLGQADGSFAANQASLGSVSTSWTVTGTGDFNGDGFDDIMWRNDSGEITQWLGKADGTFLGNSAANGFLHPSWEIASTGDFNGDGRADLLLRNEEQGYFTEWLGQADGSFADNSAAAFAFVHPDWHIAGTGDFNGDGFDDVLWRNDAQGYITEWLGQANGGFVDNGDDAFAFVHPAWFVAATGDYNGDGRDDIIWRSDGGGLAEWLGQANGGFVDNSAASAFVHPDWHIQPEMF